MLSTMTPNEADNDPVLVLVSVLTAAVARVASAKMRRLVTRTLAPATLISQPEADGKSVSIDELKAFLSNVSTLPATTKVVDTTWE